MATTGQGIAGAAPVACPLRQHLEVDPHAAGALVTTAPMIYDRDYVRACRN
jgi:hypothetical protein